MTFERLESHLRERFRAGTGAWLAGDFGRLALECFRFQYDTNPLYRGFAEGRGVTPDSVERWERIPPVPARAFKSLELISGAEASSVEIVFRTSGTTTGPGQRGQHFVRSLDLYHAALLPNFAAHVVPDGTRLPFLSLIPSPQEQPDSSLSHMVGTVTEQLGAVGSATFVDSRGSLDGAGLKQALETAVLEGTPVLLLGTAFAFVHLLDEMALDPWSVVLPEGSRIMETGGFKGRSREVSPGELYGALGASLGVSIDAIVNEYGMTELLSQFYEPVIARPGSARRHVAPPWVRTRVLHPVSLDEMPEGETGLLCHHDLANLGSVCAVLTEDLGVKAGDGFRVLGRLTDAEPRGCSLAMDELMSVGRELA